KDNVIVRSSGEPTYFATDIAYHFDKFTLRGFDRVIDVWGADHQGHVARTKAATAAVTAAARADVDADDRASGDGLEMLLYQLVHLRRGDERVRMSKRTGELVTLRELVEEVGRDVTRYFMLQRSADAQMDFDLELAASQDPKQNPVSYVQYAHARCASILRNGAKEGL
ncbi:MAG: arginine--tRNA ligase, partial [Chloroflexota bacterium]|nr:arginine--tRNA ligase [Chloroflexota bacterium]